VQCSLLPLEVFTSAPGARFLPRFAAPVRRSGFSSFSVLSRCEDFLCRSVVPDSACPIDFQSQLTATIFRCRFLSTPSRFCVPKKGFFFPLVLFFAHSLRAGESFDSTHCAHSFSANFLFDFL
jgi:hypothetical protein